MRIALGVEYDGSSFAGWQTQPEGTGVQDALEGALRRFAGQTLDTTCAGRTDAGVHATSQVVHLDTGLQRPLQAWVRGVNRFLPATVAVLWARPVADDFHARFSARARGYDYWIVNQPVRSPLLHQRAGWVFRPLDVDAMRIAADHFSGRHDFSAFRSAQCQAVTAVREIHAIVVERTGPLVHIRLVANAFLHHMVRNLVGTLVDVGVGRHPPAWAGEVLARRDRRIAAPTFAAAGLYLTRVDYDVAFGLPPSTPMQPWQV